MVNLLQDAGKAIYAANSGVTTPLPFWWLATYSFTCFILRITSRGSSLLRFCYQILNRPRHQGGNLRLLSLMSCLTWMFLQCVQLIRRAYVSLLSAFWSLLFPNIKISEQCSFSASIATFYYVELIECIGFVVTITARSNIWMIGAVFSGCFSSICCTADIWNCCQHWFPSDNHSSK